MNLKKILLNKMYTISFWFNSGNAVSSEVFQNILGASEIGRHVERSISLQIWSVDVPWHVLESQIGRRSSFSVYLEFRDDLPWVIHIMNKITITCVPVNFLKVKSKIGMNKRLSSIMFKTFLPYCFFFTKDYDSWVINKIPCQTISGV